MSINIEEANRILREIEEELEEKKVEYSSYEEKREKRLGMPSLSRDDYHFEKIVFRTRALPIPVRDGWEYRLAEKVAGRSGVKLTIHCFDWHEDEPGINKYIYASECTKIDQIKEGFKKVVTAQNELEKRINKLVDLAMAD